MSHATATLGSQPVDDRPSARSARQILADADSVAVLGASRDPAHPAHWVPKMLQEHGWQVIAVDPCADELFGHPTYGRLADIPERVDLVVVFGASHDPAKIARQAARAGAGALWLQPGLHNVEARRIADAVGMDYVQNTCVGAERAVAGMVHTGYRPKNSIYRGIPAQRQPQVTSEATAAT